VLDIPAQIRTAALFWSIAPFCSARRLSNALCDRPCGSLSLAALAEKSEGFRLRYAGSPPPDSETRDNLAVELPRLCPSHPLSGPRC